MKAGWKIAALVAVVLAVSALVWAAGGAAKGKAVFASKCAMCHGPGGEGKDAIAKMFKVEMHPLASKEVQAKSDAQLHKDIVEGNGKMKPVKLTDEEAANVIAFLRCLAKK